MNVGIKIWRHSVSFLLHFSLSHSLSLFISHGGFCLGYVKFIKCTRCKAVCTVYTLKSDNVEYVGWDVVFCCANWAIKNTHTHKEKRKTKTYTFIANEWRSLMILSLFLRLIRFSGAFAIVLQNFSNAIITQWLKLRSHSNVCVCFSVVFIASYAFNSFAVFCAHQASLLDLVPCISYCNGRHNIRARIIVC